MNEAEGCEKLQGAVAFAELRRYLGGEALIDPECFCEPAFARLAQAAQSLRKGGPAAPSPLDLAVLTRQALRYHELHSAEAGPVSLQVPTTRGWPVESDWRRVGVEADHATDRLLIRAHPWRPSWLAKFGDQGVDAAAAGESERRLDTRVPGDPFVLRFNRRQYRSPGQRSAVRAALTIPAGSTLLICLPTGDGKSFIFQLVGELGFGDAAPGVTVVVTPTIALALDQERAAQALGFTGTRLAYRGGDQSGENRQILEGIANGTQKLCFASPEAVCGPLLNPLLQAAKVGLVKALVVDEAHLVETWGASFRSGFKVLAGVRHAILKAAGGQPPRTLLLSATLTRQTMITLKAFFGAGVDGADRFAVYAAEYLRPEIDYWVAAACTEAERREHVLEAILLLPRPAILYVTKVADADDWVKALREAGFRRIAGLTGKTPPEQRQAVVGAWGQGTIDLVVGTSAFGMGIDNPHVRSVIHACVPETLDRFYQEVGRGGRDGRASISLILPTKVDVEVARGLSQPKLITAELGFERWSAMFHHPEHSYDADTDTHLLRVDVAPGVDAERIDMISDRSTEWNVHTLTLMASAGLISLLAPEFGPEAVRSDSGDEDSPSEGVAHRYQRVRILETRHLIRNVWDERFEPQRQQMAAANRANLTGMLSFLEAPDCAAALIAPLYTVDGLNVANGQKLSIEVALACGGCPHCRNVGRPAYCQPVWATPFPWPGHAVTGGPGAKLLDEGGRVVVFYPTPVEGLPVNTQRRFLASLATLIKDSAIHNLVAPPASGIDVAALQMRVAAWPLFVSDLIPPLGLPSGPTVVVVPPGIPLYASLVGKRSADDARFLFVPEAATDPNAQGVLLRQRYGGRQFTLDQFIRQVQQ